MQFRFLQKKLWLRYRYRNSTLVSVPDTDTEFRSHTTSRWHFGTKAFWHKNISAWVLFGTMDVLTRGRFGTGTFLFKDILAHGHFGTGAPVPKCLCQNLYIALQSAKMYMCQNVHVPKYPCVKMSQCRNVPVSKRPWCRNIPMLKCSRAKMSSCLKIPVMKCLCRNISCRNVRYQNKSKPIFNYSFLRKSN